MLIQLVTHPTTAHIVAVVTATFNIASILRYIPDDIGKLGGLISLILTSVLIFIHTRKYRAESKLVKLEERKLQLEISQLEKNGEAKAGS